jgi:hypothetical protein
LQDLRKFEGWTEKSAGDEPALTDETICYVWDDFTVVRSPVQEKGIIFDEITPAWKEFCAGSLHFELPEDMRPASQSSDQPTVVESAKEA